MPVSERPQSLSLREQADLQEREELIEEVMSRVYAEVKGVRELVVLQTGLLDSVQVMQVLRIDRKKLKSLKGTLEPIRDGTKDLYNPELVLKHIHKSQGKQLRGRNAGREARKRLFALSNKKAQGNP